MHWIYATAIETIDGEFVVSVRDLPEVVTSGMSHEEALTLAEDAIEVAVMGRIDDGMDLPPPSPLQPGEWAVALPLQTAAKATLYSVWKASGISKSELARRLDVRETEVRRMLDPRHGTRLDAFDRAFRALGQRAELVTVAA